MKKAVVLLLVLTMVFSMSAALSNADSGHYVWNHTGSYVDDPFNNSFRVGSDKPLTGNVDFRTDVSFSKIFFPKIWATAHGQVTIEIISSGTSVFTSTFTMYNPLYDSGDVPNVEVDIGRTLPAGRYTFAVSVPEGCYAFFAYGEGPLSDDYVEYGNGCMMFGLWTTDSGEGFIELGGSGPVGDPGLHIAGCNLSFENDVYVMYAVSGDYFDNVRLLVWNSPQSGYYFGTQDAVLTPERTQTLQGQEMLVFEYRGLAAKQMTDDVYARAYVKSGGKAYYSEMRKYSVLQYVYNKTGRTGTASSSPALIELLESMLTFGAATQRYARYRTGRLATDDFYQVNVSGGIISDLSSQGLYVPGETVTVSASEVNDGGEAFNCWVDSGNTVVGTGVTMDVTAGTRNETYTAVYGLAQPRFSYEDRGDGTCVISGVEPNGAVNIIVPGESPDGKIVTGIGDAAFLGCADVENVVLPESVTSVGERAFYGCAGLSGINVPSGLSAVGVSAFENCTGLETVCFGGDSAQWEEIDVASGNGCLEAAGVVYGFYLFPSTDVPITEEPPVYKKYFTMSFDDGITQDLRIIQILKKYDMPCTFNINTGLYGVNWSAWLSEAVASPGLQHVRFTKAQLQTGIYNGFDVEVHTLEHPDLAASYAQYGRSYVVNQVKQDEDNITGLTGIRPVGMAYPGGLESSTSDAVIRAILENSSVRFARLAVNAKKPYKFEFPEYWMMWYPTASIGGGMAALNSLADAFIAAEPADGDLLFYVWGHGYELDQFGLWDAFEAFVKRMSEQEDIVFVTNAELYELFKDEIPSWKN